MATEHLIKRKSEKKREKRINRSVCRPPYSRLANDEKLTDEEFLRAIPSDKEVP
jgi:hypothetical protein